MYTGLYITTLTHFLELAKPWLPTQGIRVALDLSEPLRHQCVYMENTANALMPGLGTQPVIKTETKYVLYVRKSSESEEKQSCRLIRKLKKCYSWQNGMGWKL